MRKCKRFNHIQKFQYSKKTPGKLEFPGESTTFLNLQMFCGKSAAGSPDYRFFSIGLAILSPGTAGA